MKRLLFIVVLIGGYSASAQIATTALVCAGNTGNATSQSCSASMAVPAGGLVVCQCDTSSGTLSASDEAANAYTALTAAASSGTTITGRLFAFYYASAASHTPKCSKSGAGNFIDITCVVYTGTVTSSFTDGTATGSGSTGTAMTTTTNITTTICGDMIVLGGSGGGTLSVSAPFTMRYNGQPDGVLADYITNGLVTQGGAMTDGTSSAWVLEAAAIKPVAPCGKKCTRTLLGAGPC